MNVLDVSEGLSVTASEGHQRVKVVDTSGYVHKRQKKHNKKRNNGSNNDFVRRPAAVPQRTDQTNTDDQWSIETQPVHRALKEYGRRAAAVGAMQGANALLAVADRLSNLMLEYPDSEKVRTVITMARAEADKLMHMATSSK